MRIKSIGIKNFRSIRELEMDIGDYSSIIGQNGAGKSNVLRALNCFFGNEKLNTFDASNWFNKQTETPIEIKITFAELTDKEQKEFKHYLRSCELTISLDITFQGAAIYYGFRLVLEEFKRYFKAEKGKVGAPQLRKIYQELRVQYPCLEEVTTLEDMKRALRDYEEGRDKKEKVEIRSDDIFYGGRAGNIAKLEQFISWVYVPAVSDATEEVESNKKSTLTQLLSHLVSDEKVVEQLQELEGENRTKIQKIIDGDRKDLESLSQVLSDQMHAWAHEGVSVDLSRQVKDAGIPTPPIVSHITEGMFQGEIGSFGNGLHRSYLFALLNALASATSEQQSDHEKTLIFAIEEPELYQHPYQIRKLASVLRDLVGSSGFQTLFTTHSPLMLLPKEPETIKRLTKTDLETEYIRPKTSLLPDSGSKMDKRIFDTLRSR